MTTPDDPRDAELLTVEEHVAEVLFDSGSSYEPDCHLCIRGVELGVFERYGFTKEDLEE